MKKVLLFGGIVVVILLAKNFISTGKKILDLTGVPTKLKYVKQAGFFQNLVSQKFNIDFEITNPNEQSLTLNRLAADIYYKGKVIANLYISKNLELPGRDKAILQGIEFSVSVVRVGVELLNMLIDGSPIGKTFDIKGTITADGLMFPIDKSIPLS
ncbi:MAG: LEA type 2 family protein [Bacteroidota bacterium]